MGRPARKLQECRNGCCIVKVKQRHIRRSQPTSNAALQDACSQLLHVLEAAQQRLDKNPQAMRQRRETAEHPFATLKMRMGATHFLMKRLPKVATEMALHVLAYNLRRWGQIRPQGCPEPPAKSV